MKIRVLRNLGSGLPPFRENQVVDVGEEEAEALIGAGLAEAAAKVKRTPEEHAGGAARSSDAGSAGANK